ncbi:RNA polymerase sigma factor [Paenibacillus harenae]|uniref:RNA polymerase sigma factor n=1 Tax=Paenibacillus harenae TaxID=306543 RepID=UPI001FDEB44C|nr:RNA polymerase sigma factor [Paenibacillus harenae]
MTSADTKSIEEICSETWEALYRFVYYKVQNREEAEDITQETYAKAYSYLQKGKIAPNKYSAFLKTVAQNVLRDLWRKKKRRGTAVDLDAINPKDYAMDDPAESSAQRHVIESALTQLTMEQRTVIELRIIKGYSVADTAKLMNKQETAVRVMQHRALQLLAAIMKTNQ